MVYQPQFKRDFECPTGWCDCDSCKDKKGQEENGTVICGRRPKQFSCMCGSRRFILVRNTSTLVDFEKEGAIEGHPHLSNIGEESYLFKCDACGATVPSKQAKEMLEEVS